MSTSDPLMTQLQIVATVADLLDRLTTLPRDTPVKVETRGEDLYLVAGPERIPVRCDRHMESLRRMFEDSDIFDTTVIDMDSFYSAELDDINAYYGDDAYTMIGVEDPSRWKTHERLHQNMSLFLVDLPLPASCTKFYNDGRADSMTKKEVRAWFSAIKEYLTDRGKKNARRMVKI